MKMLSIGNNSKLDKKTAIFNLPAVTTCPGSTSFCRKYCYALKAERLYKGAREMRKRNYDASLGPNFVRDMIIELTKFKGNHVRIHEGGEFYSQEYFNAWCNIVTQFPKITFLVYTKMYDKLDFSSKPVNMVIYASYDPTTAAKIGTAPAGLHECVIVDDASAAPAGWHVCQPLSKTQHRHYCGDSCTVCWAGSKNAVWIKH
jgi:hypothetical protein